MQFVNASDKGTFTLKSPTTLQVVAEGTCALTRLPLPLNTKSLYRDLAKNLEQEC